MTTSAPDVIAFGGTVLSDGAFDPGRNIISDKIARQPIPIRSIGDGIGARDAGLLSFVDVLFMYLQG